MATFYNPYRYSGGAASGPATAPLHWWNLDDDGIWADDGTGADWSLTERGANTNISAVSGPGGQDVPEFFDNTNIDLTLATAPWDGSVNDFSFACWARLESFGAGAFKVMAQHKPGNNTANFQMTIYSGTPIYPRIFVWDSDGSLDNLGETSTEISLNTWYHYGFTFLGSSNSATLYLNGSSIATKTMSTIDTRNTSNLVSMYIGGSPNSGWDGQVAMSGIWDVALTTDDISALYNNGNGLQYDGSVWS